MGYTGQKQRDYQRKWIAERRKQFFSDKKCEWCGATSDLQLDHINPAEKEHHCIWSWTEKRRLAEIAKCRVLCRSCHVKRHLPDQMKPVHGTYSCYRRGLCRCQECVAAAKRTYAYQRIYKKTKKLLAGTLRVERRLSDPESEVLPLNDVPVPSVSFLPQSNLATFQNQPQVTDLKELSRLT